MQYTDCTRCARPIAPRGDSDVSAYTHDDNNECTLEIEISMEIGEQSASKTSRDLARRSSYAYMIYLHANNHTRHDVSTLARISP